MVQASNIICGLAGRGISCGSSAGTDCSIVGDRHMNGCGCI